MATILLAVDPENRDTANAIATEVIQRCAVFTYAQPTVAKHISGVAIRPLSDGPDSAIQQMRSDFGSGTVAAHRYIIMGDLACGFEYFVAFDTSRFRVEF